MRKITLPITSIFLLFLSACSTSPVNSGANQADPGTRQPSGRIIEPSQLISQADVERILGGTIDEVSTKESPTGSRMQLFDGEWIFCQVSLTQQATIPPIQKHTPESLFLTIVGDTEAETGPFEALGDKAYKLGGLVHVLHDGYYITLSMIKRQEGKIAGLTTDEMRVEALQIIIRNLDALTR